MDRLAVDILGLAEVRWRGNDMIRCGEHVVIYSGMEEESGSGVSLLMKRRSVHTLRGFWPVSDIMILAKFARKPFDLGVKQVYASTLKSDDKSFDAFYSDLNSALQKRKKHEIVRVMDDLNAKVGNSQTSKPSDDMVLEKEMSRVRSFAPGVKAMASTSPTPGFRNINHGYTHDRARVIVHKIKKTMYF